MFNEQHTLSCAVMHVSSSEPRRRSLSDMLWRVGEPAIKCKWEAFKVFDDPDRKGSWWNAERCWRYGLDTGATHHLVLQDDIIPCRDFVTGVFDVIRAYPQDVISLFSGPRKAFAKPGIRWGESEGPWGPAVIMPKELLGRFIFWNSLFISPDLKHDDARISLFLERMGLTAKIPFPNLVDHANLPSFLGHDWSNGVHCADFLGDRSPHDVNWQDKTNVVRAVHSLARYHKWLI